MSFATGFFNTAADRVTERKKYIRDKNAKDRDYLMTYGTQAVRKTEEEANKAITIGKLLEGRGLERDKINFVVEQSGPQGLAILYNTIKDFKPNELSTKQLNEYVTMAEDYRPSGTTYDDMIKKSFGLYKNGVTDNPEKNEERGIWSFLGLDANAADSSMTDSYLGGYTGYDLKRIMSTSTPSLKGPLPVDRSLLPKVYSPTDNRAIFNSIEDDILNITKKFLGGFGNELPTSEDALYWKIKPAFDSEDTKTLLKLLPDASQAVMDYETRYPGSLTNNPEFTMKFTDFSFGSEAEATVTGEDKPIVPVTSMQTNYDLVKTNNPDMPEITNIAKYDTQEQALEEAEADTWVRVGIQFMKTPKSNEIKSSTLTAMSIEDMSKNMKDIMVEWEKGNPKPAKRLGEAAYKFWSKKREKYFLEEKNKLTEFQEILSEPSDVTGSIVDTDQEAFDKAIQKLVAERLLTIPDGDPNDIATVVAYKVRRTNPKYKDLKPSKIEKD